jgi:hypothetical protein
MKESNKGLDYVCSQTGIGANDMGFLISTENAPEEITPYFRKGFVRGFTTKHGDGFGSDYEQIKSALLDHMEEHSECKEVYLRLNEMYRANSEFIINLLSPFIEVLRKAKGE